MVWLHLNTIDKFLLPTRFMETPSHWRPREAKVAEEINIIKILPFADYAGVSELEHRL